MGIDEEDSEDTDSDASDLDSDDLDDDDDDDDDGDGEDSTSTLSEEASTHDATATGEDATLTDSMAARANEEALLPRCFVLHNDEGVAVGRVKVVLRYNPPALSTLNAAPPACAGSRLAATCLPFSATSRVPLSYAVVATSLCLVPEPFLSPTRGTRFIIIRSDLQRSTRQTSRAR